MNHALIAIIILVVVVGVMLVLNLVIRHKDYGIPGKIAVRCSKCHLFRTTWVVGGSLKAVRLGPSTRYQRCPVGGHRSIVHPVKEKDWTTEDRIALAKL